VVNVVALNFEFYSDPNYYCQQKLLPKPEKESNALMRSHIELMRPRASYPYLTFDYCNLSISCEGFDCETPKTNQQPKKEFCEHRKGNA